MLSLLEQRESEKEISNSSSLFKLFRSQSYLYVTHTNSDFVQGKGILDPLLKPLWLCTHMKQGGKARSGGEERYSTKAQLQTQLLCWMKAELQLARAFTVLCMGCTEERHTVMLQSHLCHTSHNYSLFSKNALFIIGESDNNCTRVALKLGALSRVGTMHQTCDNEEEHNLHKPANHHLTGIVGTVYNHE